MIEFQTLISESEDNEIRQLLLVFDNEKNSYERFSENLTKVNIQEFAEIHVVFENKLAQLEGWKQKFFHNSKEYLGENLLRNIFHITRHMAQNDGEPPKWFDFEQRQDHDLDAIARQVIEDDLGSTSENQKLKAEYERTKRYWNVIYHNFHRFKEQYNACKENILNPPEPQQPDKPVEPDDNQISKEIKEQVKKRDNYRCLCCGENKPNLLQIDHSKPKYYGGSDLIDNLQTLCNICNKTKGIETIDFRIHKTSLKEPPSKFPALEMPNPTQAGDRQGASQFCKNKSTRKRLKGIVEVSTAMFKHLRNICFMPLGCGNFQAAVNLLNCRFDGSRANRTNAFLLIVVVINNSMAMDF